MQQEFQNTNRKFKPLKKFGQNYLKDKNILRKIAEEMNILENDVVVEIGPGTGALTEFLVEKSKNIHAVEIDTRVTADLQTRFPFIKIIQSDFLKFDLQSLSESVGKKLRIVGNIPYNITSPILFKLIESRKFVADAVLMMQLEVAQRILSKPNSKEYGILSSFLNAYTKPELLFKVSPNVFYPKPKVFSAVMRFSLIEEVPIADDKLYLQLIKAAFSKRRKTLKNCFADTIFETLDLIKCGINPIQRAETLSVNDFMTLANLSHSMVGK
ncbi:MAG: 16S rRNA (adenine(1518)-N(6)/adenine(1519)-N(6))-dimethyltransferase RsmA [Ignavibacteriaceae bacterium]|jgi:16S rRNA (adenine1518-N6/adenine1519-N6)-dimethyltransferase